VLGGISLFCCMPSTLPSVEGAYMWSDDGLTDTWSCFLERYTKQGECAKGSQVGRYSAVAAFVRIVVIGEEESSTFYGAWHWEEHESSVSPPSIRMSEWHVGPDAAWPEHDGSYHPTDEIEAPCLLSLQAESKHGLTLRVEEWTGNFENIFEHTPKLFTPACPMSTLTS